MNRTSSFNKQNPSNSFYQQSTTDYYPISCKQKQLNSNLHVIDNLIIESEIMLNKLKEKISLDETKIEHNYLSLQEISEQMQQFCLQITNNKEIQNIIRQKKQFFKDCFTQNKSKTQLMKSRGAQQKEELQQLIQVKEKQIEEQKLQRQVLFSKLIDEFESQISGIQKQFKKIRKEEEQSQDKIQLLLYNLQQNNKEKIQTEKNARKTEHETIIRLIGECIENFRYVY